MNNMKRECEPLSFLLFKKKVQMVKEKIAELMSLAAEHLQYEVYDWSLYLKGENTKINVKIDKIESNVSLQDCEAFSKYFSSLLDDRDILENYSIEVSSPGLDRKLRTLDEFKRFINEPVKIVHDTGKTREGIKGKLKEVQGEKIIIFSENKDIIIEYKDIQSANLDY